MVLGAIVIDYWLALDDTLKTLSIEQVLRDDLSPGKSLFLSEDDVYDKIIRLSENPDVPFIYDETAGIRQLVRIKGDFSSVRLLTQHYLASQIDLGDYA